MLTTTTTKDQGQGQVKFSQSHSNQLGDCLETMFWETRKTASISAEKWEWELVYHKLHLNDDSP